MENFFQLRNAAEANKAQIPDHHNETVSSLTLNKRAYSFEVANTYAFQTCFRMLKHLLERHRVDMLSRRQPRLSTLRHDNGWASSQEPKGDLELFCISRTRISRGSYSVWSSLGKLTKSLLKVSSLWCLFTLLIASSSLRQQRILPTPTQQITNSA